jgi:hypothetical protein
MDFDATNRPQCPSCHAGYGQARPSTVHKAPRVIASQCERCAHVWEQERRVTTGDLFRRLGQPDP